MACGLSYNFVCLSTYFSFFTTDSWAVGSLEEWYEWEGHPMGKGGNRSKWWSLQKERKLNVTFHCQLDVGLLYCPHQQLFTFLTFFRIILKWKNSSFTTASSQCFFHHCITIKIKTISKFLGPLVWCGLSAFVYKALFTLFILVTFKLMTKENYVGGGWVGEVHSLNARYLQSSC